MKTAVAAGADAVYFAGKQFGARSFADNFSMEEMFQAAQFCTLRGVKTYLTVNTLVLDREYEELDTFIREVAKTGIDGVIVQDFGVLRRIQQICPDLPVHGSTQMTVHNIEGVKTLESMGVRRVVLSRELSQTEISRIAQSCQAELEVFVHGAMCMSYSGQCLMSSVLGGRSGNRGKCAQPCRLGYHSGKKREGFYLSLKDMSLIRHLASLDAMGVASLKIEGRMKGSEYVAAVVETYRRCIDQQRNPTPEEEARMNRVFFRGGLTDGYYRGNTGKGMFAFDKPDNPYAKQEKEPLALKEPTSPAECLAELKEGALPRLTLTALGKTVTVFGAAPLERAEKNPVTAESAKVQLAKTGGTAFRFEPLKAEIEGTPFVPVKLLNQLRREGIEALETAIMEERKRETFFPAEDTTVYPRQEMVYHAAVRTEEQFLAIKDLPFAMVEVPLSVVWKNPERFLPFKERLILAPAVIQKDWTQTKEQLDTLNQMGFCHLRAENPGVLQIRGWVLHGGHRLNAASAYSIDAYRELGLADICLSPELNLAQIRDMRKSLPTQVLVYGHLPLMLTENCILKNLDACPCDGVGFITDRKGTKLPVIRDDNQCRSVVLNSVPTYLGDRLKELCKTGVTAGRLLFTIETPEECRAVSGHYLTGDSYQPSAFTRLHFYKGV